MPLPTRPSPTRRELLATLPCGLFLAPARAATQDAWSILRRTEASYRDVLSYDVLVNSRSWVDGEAPSGFIRWEGRLAAVAPDHFYREMSSNAPRLNSGAKVRSLILCGDGRSVFQFRDNLNEYKEEVYRHTPESAPRQTEGAMLYARLHEEHFERFGAIATRPQREPRLRGEKTIKFFGRNATCLQIDTHSVQRSGGYRWSEKLWINPDNYRISQSLRGRLHLTGDRKARIYRWTEVQYDWQVLGGEVAPETFRFIPPEGAKLVERFTYREPQLFR